MTTLYAVTRAEEDESKPHLVNAHVYVNRGIALALACQSAEQLARDMVDADRIDGDDRVWTVNYDDDGASIFMDNEFAWRFEIIELTVDLTPPLG